MKLEEKLEKFKRISTNGKKRLWCFLRDYKKGLYHEMFNNAIKEVVPNNNAKRLINIWKKLPMNICLFGKNGVIPSKNKYCHVALLSCGYIAKCKEDDCIIKEGVSKEICRGD